MNKKRKLESYGFKSKKSEKHTDVQIKSIIDDDDCRVVYIENFLSENQELLLTKELENVVFKAEEIIMYGKRLTAPRETFSYGDENMVYTYARKQEKYIPWISSMVEMRDLVFKKSIEYGNNEKSAFNFVLLNKYRNENDYIGPHSDDEKSIVSESVIASLSIGEARKFNFIKKSTKEKIQITLKSKSLLLMIGKVQQEYKHELPKSKYPCDKRYNLTFRHLIK